ATLPDDGVRLGVEPVVEVHDLVGHGGPAEDRDRDRARPVRLDGVAHGPQSGVDVVLLKAGRRHVVGAGRRDRRLHERQSAAVDLRLHALTAERDERLDRLAEVRPQLVDVLGDVEAEGVPRELPGLVTELALLDVAASGGPEDLEATTLAERDAVELADGVDVEVGAEEGLVLEAVVDLLADLRSHLTVELRVVPALARLDVESLDRLLIGLHRLGGGAPRSGPRTVAG